MEGHLAAVCERHKVTLRKKDPAFSDLNDALKLLQSQMWRNGGSFRISVVFESDHKKAVDPTKDEVAELIEGVRKITKTLL